MADIDAAPLSRLLIRHPLARASSPRRRSARSRCGLLSCWLRWRRGHQCAVPHPVSPLRRRYLCQPDDHARALVEGHRKSLELAAFAPDESPRSIQLYGTDPYSIGEATRLLVDGLVDGIPVDHIDMNFGCPMKKVTRHGGGAAPLKREHYRKIVQAAVKNAGDVPVTVKFRVGIDDDAITFLDAGRIAEDEGVKAVALTRAQRTSSTRGTPTGVASRNSRTPSRRSPSSAMATSGKPTMRCA